MIEYPLRDQVRELRGEKVGSEGDGGVLPRAKRRRPTRCSGQ